MKNKNVRSIKTLPSWFVTIGTLLGVLFAIGVFIWICIFSQYTEEAPNIVCWICFVFLLLVLPIILIIGMIHRGMYSLVTIDEKGMRRSLFGVFRKVSISWDELKEMKCYYQVVAQIFCSKDIALKELTFNKAATSSKLIQIPASPKVLAVVRQYTDKEIIGFPEDKLQEAIKKYK